nr:hypothetical protein [Actinomyces sp.]
MPDVAVLTNAQEMLDAGMELADIRLDRLEIRLTQATEHDSTDEDGETPLEIECSLSTRQQGPRFAARFEFQATAPQWKAIIGVVTEYTASQDFELSEQAPGDFASRVAIMAAFPYVRQALADLTVRVTGSAALLPIIRLGEFTFRSKS